MFTASPEIEQYVSEHTQAESELLKKLSRETHLKILMPRMLSGHIQGKILTMISHMIKPEIILEIGTYTGYSAICLSEGLTENGKLHTIEINDEIVDFAAEFLKKSANSHKIIQHIGNAIEIIKNIDEIFDIVFIDGDKREYVEYYNEIFQKVKVGGFILADNILWSGKVVEKLDDRDLYTKEILNFNKFVHEDSRVENVILPIRDGIMLLRKIKN